MIEDFLRSRKGEVGSRKVLYSMLCADFNGEISSCLLAFVVSFPIFHSVPLRFSNANTYEKGE